MSYRNIAHIRAANVTAEHYFFDRSAMRFFDSRILPDLIGGRYFITSERFDRDSPRLYTVRVANDDGTVATVGEFQAYRTAHAAKAAARALAAEPRTNEGAS